MKNNYEKPEIELISFQTIDQITSSAGGLIPDVDGEGSIESGW